MGLINEFGEEKITQVLEKFKDRPQEDESDLVVELRNIAQKQYFLPFAEQFAQECHNRQKVVNSKYFLKILLRDENKLFHQDIVGESGASYAQKEDDIIMIDEKSDLYLIKGTILTLIDDLNLDHTIKHINSRITLEYPHGGPDNKVINVFDVVNTKKVLNHIESDFKNKKQDSLIYKK